MKSTTVSEEVVRAGEQKPSFLRAHLFSSGFSQLPLLVSLLPSLTSLLSSPLASPYFEYNSIIRAAKTKG